MVSAIVSRRPCQLTEPTLRPDLPRLTYSILGLISDMITGLTWINGWGEEIAASSSFYGGPGGAEVAEAFYGLTFSDEMPLFPWFDSELKSYLSPSVKPIG